MVAVWPRLRRVWRVFCFILLCFIYVSFGVSVLLCVFLIVLLFYLILSFFYCYVKSKATRGDYMKLW